jgi:hypothetical protein
MTLDDLTAKFNALSDGLLTPERQSEVKELLFACEGEKVRNIMDRLVV